MTKYLTNHKFRTIRFANKVNLYSKFVNIFLFQSIAIAEIFRFFSHNGFHFHSER